MQYLGFGFLHFSRFVSQRQGVRYASEPLARLRADEKAAKASGAVRRAGTKLTGQ